ncbi:GntR family transcriptional regulator [Pseudomonas matsuisoli]|nr:GntR family transcriptional regulator [Pseudomonas matsuisoli]
MVSSAQETSERTLKERQTLVSATGETLADTLHRVLEKEIAEGRLAPGSRLDEKEIAERFGVSRTPVREALRLLGATGLVESKGRQGVTVRTISMATLLEMFQVMAEMEGLCARLAARRITPEQRDNLEAIHRRLEAASVNRSDIDTFYEVNKEFHEAIYEASRNEFLAAQTRALRNRVGAYRRRVTYLPSRIADTLREHDEVMQAIFRHDGDAAHNAMRGHLNLLGDNLVDFIAHFS